MTKTLVGLAAALAASAVPAQPFTGITLTPVGQLATGSASEIAAYEASSDTLFVINGDSGGPAPRWPRISSPSTSPSMPRPPRPT